ncbi:ankyrin repeat protein, putative [Trichomonas vaginalis G3]|uniref:Ankyrin repeat protein, putative n=1 Tax=Trichomonas vaginalis (strain ATCC PRA-98 / G3) TaxID=412133 RepID=A2EIP7_TRIV3|nr:ankyrin repeat and SOCS box-containing protein 4 family [Trichomonas vaginalis G3]EAY07474.1 ankyrin repeat protein, putative [Trichomonas vaginalis G3]KAI5487830.1 ankyrin repeat and SOCS box-containing protein 4 family [Trichomonas vaginalis G3]|eukprot:XP_001319697.1 ankyrin repeat protein [Trichomonas vaginalis G3]
MYDPIIKQHGYLEFRSIYANYIDLYNALYQLKTENEEELNLFYNMIKSNLINSKKYDPQNIIGDILNIVPYNYLYSKSYLKLAKLISDEYHVKEVRGIKIISNYIFYKEYGIKLDITDDFEILDLKNTDIHDENTIYRAIMHDDKEGFISFIERDEFDEDQKLESEIYLDPITFSLLELCCYHGAVHCFKLLRTKFDSEITQACLQFSFLGRNQEIISECLKYQKPDHECMKYAIISHNIDFVTFLMNEYNLDISLYYCGLYNNLESFLIYLDQTNDIHKCFVYSAMFNIPSLCKYFIFLGANINDKVDTEKTALHFAGLKNNKEIVELLLSHGANVNVKDMYGETVLNIATRKNSKEIVELLLSHGANINEKYGYGETVLHRAVYNNCKETIELLLSHGANINEKECHGLTALHNATMTKNKEMVELLLSHRPNINEKDKTGDTALHFAAARDFKEIAEILLSNGAYIKEKNYRGKTALDYAEENNSKETRKLLLSLGANINS